VINKNLQKLLKVINNSDTINKTLQPYLYQNSTSLLQYEMINTVIQFSIQKNKTEYGSYGFTTPSCGRKASHSAGVVGIRKVVQNDIKHKSENTRNTSKTTRERDAKPTGRGP